MSGKVSREDYDLVVIGGGAGGIGTSGTGAHQ